MKSLFAAVCLLSLSGLAYADKGLVCKEISFAADPSQYDRVPVQRMISAFIVHGPTVVYGSWTYVSLNDESGNNPLNLSPMYFNKAEREVLYIFNDKRGKVIMELNHLLEEGGMDKRTTFSDCNYI